MMSGPTGTQPEVTHPVSVIVLAVLSMIFQLVGFVTPGWAVRQLPETESETESSVQANLWYVVRCHGDDCQSDVIESAQDLLGFKSYRVEASIALCTIIVAVGVAIRTRRKQTNSRYNIMAYLSIGFLCLSSGILSLSSTGRLADLQNEYEKISMHGENLNRFPYSLLLTGLGGAIAMLVVLSSVRMIYRVSKVQERPGGNAPLNAGELSMYPTGHIAYNQYQSAYANPTFPPTQMDNLEPTESQVNQQNATNEDKTQGIAPSAYQLPTGSSMPQ